jgi:hypothetical protein
MEPFRDNVFYLLLWRAILAALIGLVSMATCRLGPAYPRIRSGAAGWQSARRGAFA